MAKATLTCAGAPVYWDSMKLVISQDLTVTQFLHLKERNVALDLYRQLAIAHFNGYEGSLSFEIDGENISLSYACWKAALSCLDQWYEGHVHPRM